jgi:phage-related protein
VVPLNWIGSSKKDLLGMPNEVQQVAGYGLCLAQAGRNHPTPALANSICVLHAFKKKSTRGKATPKRDIERVEERLKWAEEQHRAGRLPSQRSTKRRE